MARYPLSPLLAARRLREEAAERATRLALNREEEAKEGERKARQELERYRSWRPGEEERLFELLRNRLLPQSELDSHREDIHALRDGERLREEEVAKAAEAVVAAGREVEEARRRQAQASRDVRKIDEHRLQWQREEDLRLERLEEAELEEIPHRAPEDEGAEEWEETP